MELNEAIKSRRSVRKFKSKEPNWRIILECIDAARFAPMAGNNFTLRFIMVRDKETINKLSEAAQQDFVSNAKCIVVFISDPKITINAYGEKKGEIYSRQQAGAAIQNFLLKIVEAGLSTCWTGYFVEEIVKRILKIPENYNVEGIFPIGYESSKSSPKRKISLENTLFFEKYGQKKIKPDKKIYS